MRVFARTLFIICVVVGLTAAPISAGEVQRIPARSAATVVAPQPFDAIAEAREMTHLHERLLAARAANPTVDLGRLSAADETVLNSQSGLELQRVLVGIDRGIEATVDLARDTAADGKDRSSIGRAHTLFDGTYVWSATFRSPGATAVRAHLVDIDLPQGAALYAYNNDGDAFGPYTHSGALGRSEIWTNTVGGDTITLQVEVSAPVTPQQRHSTFFTVASIGHMGENFHPARWGSGFAAKSFCTDPAGPVNASCVENAACSSVPAAVQSAEQAVAAMLYRSGGSYYICSGGLVADTQGSMTPYFLTANHCVSKGNEASSLETYFDFTAPCGTTSCTYAWAGGRATPGATILSTNRTSDYTLLQLAAVPSGRTYLGWNAGAVANSNGTSLYRLSHPSGSPQAFSTHSVDTSTGTCTSWPRGSWIYSADTFGATEGGSSGSPVLNSSGEIVGQLSGACGTNLNDTCDAVNNATVDGAFAAYFGSVSQWLDGGGGGCVPSTEVCDGVDNDCDGLIDEGDVCGGACTLGQIGDACAVNADCCSSKCRGRAGRRTCR